MPICTGEDIYLKEGFEPLLKARHLGHPSRPADHRRHPGDQEDRRHGAGPRRRHGHPHGRKPDRRDGRGPCRGRHRELHGARVSLGRCAWWDDIVTGLPKPLVKNGFIEVPDKPGLGIDDVVDEVIAQHLQPGVTGIWQPTDQWDDEYSWDRTWS